MAKDKNNTARSIEDLTSEYERLNTRKIQAQTELKTATEHLEKLQNEAVEEFETSDIDELQAKLNQMEVENEQRRGRYQELLEGISKDLKEVEAKSAKKLEHSDDD